MTRRLAVPLAVALLCVAAARANQQAASDPEQLTADENAVVRKLAELVLKERGLLKGKVYLTRIEVFHDSARGERHAIATHYRYEGDLAILTHVNLGTRKATEVETVPHLPTPLSPEELAEAVKLARADRQVARALARYADGPKIEVDSQMAITAVADAPTFRHRVVRLHFRRGHEYLLHVPGVDVDLTARTVRVEAEKSGHN